MGIYAALGVPEVWRCEEQRFRIWLLGADGQYQEAPQSVSFPFLPVSELLRFVELADTMSDIQLMRTFRTWVREQVARGWPTVG
jgi:hypothetical protein